MTFLPFIIKYRHFIGYGLAVVVILSLAGTCAYLNTRLDTEVLKRKEAASQLKSCVDNHILNKEIENEYQTQINDLNKRLSASKRVFNNQCIPVIPSRKPDATPASGYVRENGINADALLEYGYDCGQIEIQLRSLQGWIERVK